MSYIGLSKKVNRIFFIPIGIFIILFVFSSTKILFAATPTVVTGAATEITTTTAELNGSVPTNGGEQIFEVGYNYGLTTGYGSSITTGIDYVNAANVVTSLYGSGDGETLTSQGGMAVDSSGNIYIVDSANHRVQKFNSAGVYQSPFGVEGTGDGEFSGPKDIAIDSLGFIYVVDQGNSRVQKFNSAGVYQLQFGVEGNGDGEFAGGVFGGLFAIYIDSLDNVYVVDTGNHRVQKFNTSGEYQSQFGTVGLGNGQFTQPGRMAVDSSGNIYVTDTGNVRVQKFNSAGVYQSHFLTSGAGIGAPSSVTLDHMGNIYIPDSSCRIVKFNSAGVYQSLISTSCSPVNVLVHSDDRLYVIADNNTDMVTVEKFSLAISPTEISSLACGTEYHFQAYAENIDGIGLGSDSTFTTDDCDPPSEEEEQPAESSNSYGFQMPQVRIQDNLKETSSSIISLQAIAPFTIIYYEISNTPDFINRETYMREYTTRNLSWDLCKGLDVCVRGTKRVYGRFYNERGDMFEDAVDIEYIGNECPYFKQYLRKGSRKNTPEEVIKAQKFLNQELGISLVIDGVFGEEMDRAVRMFQEKYPTQIIRPWPKLKNSTGWWYITTSGYANVLVGC